MRLIHLWLIADGLFFDAPVIDARQNVEDARYLLEQSWAGPAQPLWKPPLYSYLLAFELWIFGDGLIAPRLVQIALDAVSCWLVYRIGVGVFSHRVGVWAAAVVALSGPMIFFSGELVSASLATCLYLVVLALLLRARSTPEPVTRRWWWVGAAMGLASLVRPEILLLAVLAIWVAVQHSRSWRTRDRWLAVAAVLAGIGLFVVPVTVRNYVRGGDAVAISANGGINLYIGTDPAFHGMVGLRPGSEWERLMREPAQADIVQVGSRHSAYFVRKSLALVAADPVGYAGHALGKGAMVWHGHEIMSNFDLYDARSESWVLAALLWDVPGLYFPFGLLGPLCLVGAVLAARSNPAARVLIAYAGVLTVVAMLFFVTARFRMPLVPVAAVFAAYAVDWAIRRWSHRDRAFAAAAGATLALVLFANSSAFGTGRAAYQREVAAEKHHYRGTVLFAEYRRDADAVVELRAALTLVPDRASTHYNLGQVYERQGEWALAAASMQRVVDLTDGPHGEHYLYQPAIGAIARAVAADSALAATEWGGAVACMTRGQWDCAVAGFTNTGDSALAGLALVSRAERALLAHEAEHAQRDLTRAVLARPRAAVPQLLLGLVFHRQGKAADAAGAFAAFRRLDWPAGNYYRGFITGQRVASPLDREILAAIVAHAPDDRRAQRALAAASSR